MSRPLDETVHTVRGLDVLRDVRAGRVPSAVARRERLVALRLEAMDLVAAEHLLDVRASWRIVPLQGEPGASGWLQVDGQRLQAPWLVPASGQLTGVACAVATIGSAIDRRSNELFAARKPSLGMALDGLANELLFALSRRVLDRVLAQALKAGLCVAGELRAGDPGLELQAQQVVLQLAGAAHIDVALTQTMMMNPTKSTSIVQGVGLGLPPQTWSRCDTCRSRDRCALVQDRAAA